MSALGARISRYGLVDPVKGPAKVKGHYLLGDGGEELVDGSCWLMVR